jgi:hypothetical protein
VSLSLLLPFLISKVEEIAWKWMEGRRVGPQSRNKRPILGTGETKLIKVVACGAFFWSVRHELKPGEMVIFGSRDMVGKVSEIVFIETFCTFLKRSAGVLIDQ